MTDNILQPNYTITPAIEAAIEGIERDAWMIDKMLIMPKHETWIRRNVTAERASGTVRIEGGTLDQAEVRELMRTPPKAAMGEDERANRNALSAYDFVDYLSDQSDLPIDEATIRQINREFMRGFLDKTPGAYRVGEIKIYGFTPPNQGDVPDLMREFAGWLRQDSDLNPVLRAGIAHIHLVAIHPFWDGNGRTARALATLIMQKSPHRFKKLLALESHMFKARDEYLSAIERTLGPHFSTDYDVTQWLEFFSLHVSINASNLADILTDWHREMEKIYASANQRGLRQRQAEAFVFAFQTGKITRSDYVEITGVSSPTASRDLVDLVEKGFLRPDGNTRARVYYPLREGKSQDEQNEKQPSLI